MKPTLLFKKRSPTLPMILQDETAECGHACVAMIGTFWGHSLDLHAIRKINKSSNRGVTLQDINKLFDYLGFTTRALRVELTELSKINTPAIIHWNMNHFVVLKRVTKNHIIIHDPAVGIRRCSLEEASKSFTGIALEVEKSNDFQVIKDTKKLTLFDLIKMTRGIGTYVVFLLLLSLSIEILSLINPLFMQYVTDKIIGSSNLSNLYVIAIAFSLMIGIQTFAEYIRGNMAIYLSNHLTEQFSSNIVKHILRLPLEFFEKRHKGDIQSKFLSVDQIQKKISTEFISTAMDGLMIVINMLVMMIYSATLTTLVLSSLLIFLTIRGASYHFLKRETESSLHQHAKAASIFLETLQGIVPIKSFLKEHSRFNTWRNCYIQSLNADIKISRMNVIYNSISQLLFNIEHILVVTVGAWLVLSGRFSAGMLIAFLAYRLLLVNKASLFIHSVFDYKLISVQLNRLSDILFQEPEIITTGRGNVENVQGALELKNISFKYNQTDNNVLNDISIQINAGEKIAIVGASGCGKSTLLKIMMGLLHQTSGTICLDDIPIHEFGLKNYRDIIASVMQDDCLLSGSIIDNISFFDESLDLDRVYHVTKIACIHDSIIKLAMGYETLVGDMGSTLSGGQKQRLLLARALYKQPKILFLDEATSHMDADCEQRINKALKILSITQIVIAHRIETIQMADRVIDLEELMSTANACANTTTAGIVF